MITLCRYIAMVFQEQMVHATSTERTRQRCECWFPTNTKSLHNYITGEHNMQFTTTGDNQNHWNLMKCTHVFNDHTVFTRPQTELDTCPPSISIIQQFHHQQSHCDQKTIMFISQQLRYTYDATLATAVVYFGFT